MGAVRTIDVGHSDVLVHHCEFESRILVFVHCFHTETRCIDLGSLADDVIAEGDLLSNRPYDGCDFHELEIDGLGYRWIATVRRHAAPDTDGRDEEPSPNPRQADETT